MANQRRKTILIALATIILGIIFVFAGIGIASLFGLTVSSILAGASRFIR